MEASPNTLVRMRYGDLVGFILRVVLPTWAKGIVLRRPGVLSLAARWGLDAKAVRYLHYLRRKYGTGPLLLPNPIRPQLLLLDERDVRRVLAETPEPFTPASAEKRAALSHFEPHNALITRGPQRQLRRKFHDDVLQSRQPVHDCGRTFLTIVRSEAQRLLRQIGSADTLGWQAFSDAWFAAVRRIVLGERARDDAMLIAELTRLRAQANWVFFRSSEQTLRAKYRARLTQYLDAAEAGSLAARIARDGTMRGTLAADQVTQWLFAFDAGAMTTFRAQALLLADRTNMARAKNDLAAWRADKTDLPYLRAAFVETVRLYPTVPALLRQATAPTSWDGQRLDKDAGVVIYAPFFHRDTERLPYADRFTPEIWLGRDPADALPLVPFSFGPAACPGRHVVSLIGSLWLAVLLSEGDPVLLEPRTLNPSTSLPATLDHFAIRFKICSAEPFVREASSLAVP